MVGPISVNGPASGIDTSGIIAKLISIQTAPEQVYQNEISVAQAQQAALLQVNIDLLAMKSATDQLRLPSLFNSTALSSSNSSALTASTTGNVAAGQYTFSVAQLAQAHQLVSNGFQDSTSTPVASVASTLSIEVGGGFLDRTTPLSFLNGQTGFDRGEIRIRDSSGATTLIDLSGATNLQDIVNAINSSSQVSVKASLNGNRIVIRDMAGGLGSLAISDAGGTSTATSLGIAGSGVAVGGAQYIFGQDINQVNDSTPLSGLNGGLGVRTNGGALPDFSVTEGSGGSAVTFNVTLQSGYTTLGQVITRINNSAISAGSTVRASLNSEGNALVLASTAGGGLAITPTSGSFAAVDLGLGTIVDLGLGSPPKASFVQNATEDALTGQPDTLGNQVVGSSLASSFDGIQRTLLNGGQTSFDSGYVRGLPDGSITLTDRLGNSATVNVSANVDSNVLNATGAGATSLTLGSLDGFAVGNQFRVQTSTGIEYRTITALDATAGTISFDQALKGSVTAGTAAVGINGSLADIVRTINQGALDSGVGIQVAVNQAQDGLQASDTTGGTANLILSGAAATNLGIAGSVNSGMINGTSLHAQYIGMSTLLASLNAGKGVAAGQFQITDTQGKHFTVNLNQSTMTSVGQVLQNINAIAVAAGSGVVARINNTGNGILLEDTTPGSGTLQIQDLNGGRTARDLNIAGSASASTRSQVDGSFQHAISIAAGADLQAVADAINAQGLGVTASIINDGSSSNAFHLALTSLNSGEAGRLTVDSTIPGLTFTTTAAAQDAVVTFGGGNGASPTVVRSSNNTVTGVIPGMSLLLNGVSSGPVTITAATDTQSITTQVQKFVDSYNKVAGEIQSDTAFNASTNTPGILFGSSALQEVSARLSDLLTNAVPGIPAGQINTLAAVGISVGQQGTLSFDKNAFSAALQNNLSQVENLFTEAKKLDVSTKLSAINSGAGITDTPGPDFMVTAKDGTSFNVDIAGSKTLGDLILAINNAAGNNGRVTAGISSDGFSLQLTDHTVGTNPFRVADIGDATAASELKIATTAAGGENVLKGGVLTLSGSPGLGAQFSDALNFLTESGDGVLTVESNNFTTKINDLNQSISNINAIAAQMQISLVQQFAALEAIIASSQTTSQELQAILGSTSTSTTNSTGSLQSILGSNTAGSSTTSSGTNSPSNPTTGTSGNNTGSSSSGG